MTVHDESLHPRTRDGKFTKKTQAEADITLVETPRISAELRYLDPLMTGDLTADERAAWLEPSTPEEFDQSFETSQQLRRLSAGETLALPDGCSVTCIGPADADPDDVVESGHYTIAQPDGATSTHPFNSLYARSSVSTQIALAATYRKRLAPVEAPGSFWDDADVIHVYSREDALRDGALVDHTALAREAGFKHPLALTAGAQADAVTWTGAGGVQDETGRAWDVLIMAAHAARQPNRPGADPHRREFTVYRVPNDGRSRTARPTRLVLHIGPGDTPDPVMTVMLPGED